MPRSAVVARLVPLPKEGRRKPACQVPLKSAVIRFFLVRKSVVVVDTRTPEQRSAIMRSVRTQGTGPELAVRSILHRLGFRFRVHDRSLPGCPDIVLPRHRKVVFVHGCFWHGHACTKGALPKSRLQYWEPKIRANKRRDARNLVAIRKLDWQTVIVWQCELKDPEKLARKLAAFMRRRPPRRRAAKGTSSERKRKAASPGARRRNLRIGGVTDLL